MSRFEEVGMNLQIQSDSKSQAERRFEYSCELCCKRGLRIDCDRCGINVIHQRMVKFFDGVAPVSSEIKINFVHAFAACQLIAR